MNRSAYKWHHLEDGRGYYSCHVSEGAELVVVTTPICDSEADAKKLMEEKISKLKTIMSVKSPNHDSGF